MTVQVTADRCCELRTVALLFFGGKMVLRSEDNPDVIMNSLAAYFVAEMDECACALRSDGRIRLSLTMPSLPLCPDVYQYLCPPAIQRVLEDEKLFPPLGKNQTSRSSSDKTWPDPACNKRWPAC